MKFNTKKIAMILIACLVLAGFGLSFFHHHEDGGEHHDCVVCHFTQAVRALSVLAVIFLIGLVFAYFLPFEKQFFARTFLSFSLLARAPPVLS